MLQQSLQHTAILYPPASLHLSANLHPPVIDPLNKLMYYTRVIITRSFETLVSVVTQPRGNISNTNLLISYCSH